MNLIQSRAHGAEIPNAFVIIIALSKVYIHITVYIECAKKCYFRYTICKVKAAQIGAYHYQLRFHSAPSKQTDVFKCLFTVCHPPSSRAVPK